MHSKWLKYVVIGAGLLAGDDAFAAQRLAVGAAGVGRYPVYVVAPRGAAEIADDTYGVFREPVYTTPRGYRYTYVRGYRLLPHMYRTATGTPQAVVKKKIVRVAAKPQRMKGVKRAGCVTDLGNGRYEYCG